MPVHEFKQQIDVLGDNLWSFEIDDGVFQGR